MSKRFFALESAWLLLNRRDNAHHHAVDKAGDGRKSLGPIWEFGKFSLQLVPNRDVSCLSSCSCEGHFFAPRDVPGSITLHMQTVARNGFLMVRFQHELQADISLCPQASAPSFWELPVSPRLAISGQRRSNAVTAKTFLARGEATPGQQSLAGKGGLSNLCSPMRWALCSRRVSRKPAQRIGARNVQSGTVRNRTTAARERPQETARPSRTDAEGNGRGRTAKAPWEIPWKGWKDILWRTYAEVGKDRLLAVAAGVVFYGLLALFPAITAIVSLYGFFAQASGINEHLSLIAGLLPGGAVEIIQEQVTRIVSKGETRLTFAFAFGLALALWNANAGMKALIDALTKLSPAREARVC